MYVHSFIFDAILFLGNLNLGKNLMNLLSSTLPLISNLQTSRFFLSSINKNNQTLIMDHQNSLQCLSEAVKLFLR